MWITKSKEKAKETKMYRILSTYFIFVGMYTATKMFKLSPQVLANVNTIFDMSDLPAYEFYHANDCPLCRRGDAIDAISNGYGYSMLG